MKIQKHLLVSAAVMLSVFLTATKCNNKKEETKDPPKGASVKPVPLPTNIVPGFNFPEQESVINGWTNNPKFPGSYDSASIYNHAWGIWAGLTAPSGETFAGDKLLVYQTWLGLNEVRQLVIDNDSTDGCTGAKRSFGRAPLTRATQLQHAARFTKQNAAKFASQSTSPVNDTLVNQWVTVSYSPDAACFATKNQIFRQSVINKYYQAGGLGAIPAFPNTSLTIKPTYLVYNKNESPFKMPVWLDAPNPPNANFFGLANNYVYVDATNSQPAGKTAVPVSGSETDKTKIAAATINLNDFISLTVDKQMADYMNQQDSIQGMTGSGKALPGQVAILVGMHVTTKEISNWTWQSYYWTPNPAQPGSPSSALAASLRPSQITGAAAHYACVAAYVMLTPNNASNSTAGAGPMFGYNPYLEGSFGPPVFGFPNTYNKNYQYGVQTNCMSCHALAIPSPAGNYTTDQTIDLKGDYFKGQVSLDFAWSIQTALINDAKPYWSTQ